MSDDSRPSLPPFPSAYRASGLLVHVTSLPYALWHWRRGTSCDRLHRSTLRRRPKLVAVVAVGPNWVRQLSLSIALVFCRQRAPDQSRLAH